MKGEKRLYIVSFGDSRKYKVEFNDNENIDNFHHTDPLADVEEEIREFLDKEFPGEPLAYYTTPRITEVNYSDRDQYLGYPELDRVEIERIKCSLRREVEVRDEDDIMLNLNAPYDKHVS